MVNTSQVDRSPIVLLSVKVFMNSSQSLVGIHKSPCVRLKTICMSSGLNNSLAMELFAEILAQDNILLSVNSGSAICEARVEKGLPFKIREKWATIGDETRSWHVHLNMEEVKEARFVRGGRSDGRRSYSIRFFDSKGNLAMRTNFTGLYDSNGRLIIDRIDKYEEIHRKFGGKDLLLL